MITESCRSSYGNKTSLKNYILKKKKIHFNTAAGYSKSISLNESFLSGSLLLLPDLLLFGLEVVGAVVDEPVAAPLVEDEAEAEADEVEAEDVEEVEGEVGLGILKNKTFLFRF